MDMKYSKNIQLSSELLVIDGLWGVGKSVVTHLVSTFDSAESVYYDYTFDYIPKYYQSHSIDKDAAVTLIRNLFDEFSYKSCISRSVNFRFTDETSIFKHPKKYKYLQRLFQRDGDDALKIIAKNRMIIPILTHMSSSNNDFFHMAMGERCKIINCIRHPLFMLEGTANYLSNMALSPRDFVLKIRHNDKDLPFFAHGWEDEFLSANYIEKAIKSISILTKDYTNNLKKIKKQYGENSILEVSFEDAITNTDEVLNIIAGFIDRDINQKLYKKIKKSGNFPRKSMLDGQEHGLFNFKSKKVDKVKEKVLIQKKMELFKSKVRPEYYLQLVQLVKDYEVKSLYFKD